MKKVFTLIALGSVAIASANQYYQPSGNGMNSCPTCNNGGGYYQGQPSNGGGYYQNQPNSGGGYYQGQSNGNYYQQNQNSRGYYQRDGQNYQQNSPQQGNQSYDRIQQKNPSRTTSDQEIKKKIQDTLSSGWFSKGFQNVSADVNNGNVNLSGSVDTMENRNKIEESVRKIDGVKQVNNQISIVKEKADDAYSDTKLQDSEKKFPLDVASNAQDRQINAKIRNRLSDGWFSKGYETIVIRTNNGVVIISGTVDKSEDIQKINDEVKAIDGVKSVINQIAVTNK